MDNTYLTCVTEMFKRVGLEYPNKELTDQDNWFEKYTWTEEEEIDFKKWVIKLLMKKHKYRKKHAEFEAGCFLLDVGWKIKEE